ncbi:MAG: ArsR family transcriptional regulator, partial [Firmicutes bacterium]|nr:ArsR family transcriptional regulator [Bacillota bacterium]
MEILKNNNWCKINEAFQLFVNTGRIMPDALRPEVERSWNRCRNIDPWTPRPNPISQAECDNLVKENAELMEFSKPVLQYMYATNTPNFEDNIAQLAEKTGVILDICTRVCTLPNPLNKKVSEESIGTSITGIALAENISIELGGTELLKACYQTCYGVAAPVNDADGNLQGVISLYNNYGKIPEQPLEFVITAAKLIEDLLKNKHQARNRPITDNKYFTEMIN